MLYWDKKEDKKSRYSRADNRSDVRHEVRHEVRQQDRRSRPSEVHERRANVRVTISPRCR